VVLFLVPDNLIKKRFISEKPAVIGCSDGIMPHFDRFASNICEKKTYL
jgi:hypothetical protein